MRWRLLNVRDIKVGAVICHKDYINKSDGPNVITLEVFRQNHKGYWFRFKTIGKPLSSSCDGLLEYNNKTWMLRTDGEIKNKPKEKL